MGNDKALLLNNGETQLAMAVRLLQGHLGKIFVSARVDQSNDSERGKFEQILDCYDDMGPIAGVLSAMDHNPDVSWLVLACDLPNIDDETIRHLLDNQSVSQPFTAYQSTHDDLPEPLCALYRPESAGIVRAFVAEGMICPRKMMIRSDTHLLRQPNPHSLDNVNTPDDLHKSHVRIAS
jgi:molybdopterin-guanine dinucleotide biosynthesis protein A